jgi:hypothetical protein
VEDEDMSNLLDINQATLRSLLGTRCYSAAACAIGTTKSKVKTTNAISYSIAGIMYAKAATDDFFVHTDVTVQPISTTRAYLLCIDAAGDALIVRETAPIVFSPGNLGVTTGKLPALPAGYAPVGVLKIVTDATNTFTPATTLNDAAGITATYTDLACMIESV